MSKAHQARPDSAAGTEPNLVEYLPWDSDFFGVRIARLHGESLTQERSMQADNWCHDHRIQCLYFLADFDSRTAWCAEDAGFRLMDLRFTLRAAISDIEDAKPAQESFLIREALLQDASDLKRIAAASHHNTRFYRDPHFDTAACNRLYETWIEKSLSRYAGVVLVAEIDGRPGGYSTCQVTGAEGEIGLVAVAPEYRRKGLAVALVRRSIEWFRSRSVLSATVVTQGVNTGAIRVYERAGFVADSVRLWYHKWYAEAG